MAVTGQQSINIGFPNTDCYLVTYEGGSCGGLVTTILTSLVLDKEIDCDPSSSGNSHDGLDAAQATWDINSKNNYYKNDHLHVDNVYLYAKPAKIESPIILFDHRPIDDYNTLAKVYPKFKQIVITFEEKDCPQIRYNLFTKFTCHYFENNNISWNSLRHDFLNNDQGETWINQYDNPNDLLKNKEHLKIFVNVSFNSIEKNWQIFGKGYNKDKINTEAGEFNNQVFYIKFEDIMRQPSVVLSQLATITGKDITPNIENYYNDWLGKQEFIEDLLDI
jgi:hypothetical protein